MRWLVPGAEVTLEQPCLDCGETIRVRLRDDELLEIDPVSAVGYMPSPFAQWRDGSGAFN